MKGLKRITDFIPKRLITTTILMASILVLIVVLIVSLITEKSRIQAALDLSQRNREQLLRTENVTQSLVVTEARFKEYCTTFEKAVFDDYQLQVKSLAENIVALQQLFNKNATGNDGKITEIFDEKTKEADVYMKLRLATDSLIFSVGNLRENQVELEKYIGSQSDPRIDTLSVTATKESYKKGLFGKLKSALIGEKVKENVTTRLRIQSDKELEKSKIRDAVMRALEANKTTVSANKFNELVQKSMELKESELKLIQINNSLIAQIQNLVEDIKISIRNQEAKYNNVFLKSVQHSTNLLQNILIVLMIVAFALAIYIMLLAYRNDKFQDNIISLNAKILKDSIEKDKFYSIVSHDIMNPFNALLGFSKILKEAVKEGDQKEVEECSVIVHQSAERISNLLQNLLVWSRVQNGKIQFAPQNRNVNQLVSEAMAIVAPIARNKTINLNWNVLGEIDAEFDKNMITSVLQNLVTNAIKFTPKGGEVKVSASSDSSKLKVVVSDNGVGMNEEQLSKLFRLDKASSSKGTDEETGTGLGLIIAREFIEKHNGQIWAESEVGKGSKFCFDIPLGR
jgi:signal transduction histidine kinase